MLLREPVNLKLIAKQTIGVALAVALVCAAVLLVTPRAEAHHQQNCTSETVVTYRLVTEWDIRRGAWTSYYVPHYQTVTTCTTIEHSPPSWVTMGMESLCGVMLGWLSPLCEAQYQNPSYDCYDYGGYQSCPE